MAPSKLLTIEDLIDELGMGRATLKFILDRFSPWLATQVVNEETYYSEQTVTTLIKIRKFLDTGMLPEQIETSLVQEAEILKATATGQSLGGNQGAMSVDMESAFVFKDMLQVFFEKQDRIASAQEALTRVEERKADAMEKRAAAEEKKADAMTNIALALQEMNQRYGPADPQAMEIAGRAVQTLALEDTGGFDQSAVDTSIDENEALLEDPVPLEDPFKDQDYGNIEHTNFSDIDDLSLLTNEATLTPEEIDDLSSLIDSVSDPDTDLDNLESLLEETPPPPETSDPPSDMDDLSKLVDSDSPLPDSLDTDEVLDDLDDLTGLVDMAPDTPKNVHEDLDDLSSLIAPAEDKAAADLDDLSALVDEPAQSRQVPVDDLSLLIKPAQNEPAGDLDDLSALVKKPTPSPEPVDDLSLLVGGTKEKSGQKPIEVDASIDDLWSLVSDPPQSAEKEPPSIKPDISPDQDKGKYKAAVMKIIIELKGQGLTPQQTTDRLNHDGVATLSGKSAWGVKAIEKIYGFIDSAK